MHHNDLVLMHVAHSCSSLFALKAGLIFQFPNDCDGDSFEIAMREVFRAFASFVSKVWSLYSM